MSGKPFEVSEEDLKFYETISPLFGGKKYLIPAPTLCPEERRRRRMALRNERTYYKYNCDICNKSAIGAYSSDKSFKKYCSTCWWGDAWDAFDHGRDFDFTRPFFEQFAEMMKGVPRLGTINANAENSDYTSYGYGNKDCYLLSTCDYNEKCYYGCFVWKSFQCLDCLSITNCHHCYQCVDGESLYECQYCRGCVNCRNCFGCIDSRNLNDCFGCVNLQNKQYCFFNEQLSKEEYEKKVQEARHDIPGTLKKIKEFQQRFPKRATFQVNCENCLGDHLKDSKNLYWAFDGYGAEDSKWLVNFPGGIHHCYDLEGGGDLEWSLEATACGAPGNHILFSDHCFDGGRDLLYSSYCIGCKDCFGCVGLKKKQYCILNKQYKKEEYEELVPKIIEHMKKTGEWGEFFPIETSPFAYNETPAQQIFPVEKEEALKKNWKWKNEERELIKYEKLIPADKLPKDISKIPDDILNWAIECEISKKPFKIIAPELAYYRKFNLPVPTVHPDERHNQRMALRNPQNLWEKECGQCRKKITTSYPPSENVNIYCEECYLQEVY